MSLFLVLISGCWLHAKTAIVQNMNASDIEYYSFVSKNKNLYQTFSKQFVESLEQLPEQKQIRKVFLKAQSHYTNKEFYRAKLLYLRVVSYYNEVHLNEHGQQLVLKSLEKLIELSHNKEHIQKYKRLLKGGAFANLDNKKLKTWIVPERLQVFDKLIINGQIYDMYPGLKVQLPINTFLITVVSNKMEPISEQHTYASLKKWDPNLTWFDTSTCDVSENKKLSRVIFFSSNCVLPNQDQHLKTITPVKDLMISHKPKPTPSINLSAQINKPKWYKNKWLWLGAGLVTTAVIIASRDDKKKPVNNSPTVKQGF